MKKFATLTALIILFISSPAIAVLIDLGGGLIYDDVLSVTWLQDANYARTTGYSISGNLQWEEAMTWVDNLEYYDSVRDVTHNNWRLPKVLPVNGSYFNYTYSFDGSTDVGHNISAPDSAYPSSISSELSYMYHVNMDAFAYYDVNGNVNEPRWGPGPEQVLPFINYQYLSYATGTIIDTEQYWAFSSGSGLQYISYMPGGDYVWPVMDGNAASIASVPEPSTMLLLGTGLIGLARWGKKRFKKR